MKEAFEQHTLTWTDVTELAREYRWIILGVFLAGILGMYVSLQVLFTDIYESRAGILVKVGRENADTPASVQNGQLLVQGVREADINSEVQMLSSRSLVEDVVDKLGPDTFKSVLSPPESVFGYPKYALKWTARKAKAAYKETLILANLQKRLTPREQAIEAAMKGLQVEPVRDSDTLVVRVGMPAAPLAVQFSETLLDLYMKNRAAVRSLPAGATFFKEQMEENRMRLEAAARERDGIRQQWHVSSGGEQRSLQLKKLSDVEGEMLANQVETARLTEQIRQMTTGLLRLPAFSPKEQVLAPNPSIQAIKDRLASLQVERAKLAARYLPESDAIKAIESEISDLEKVLTQQPPTVIAQDKSEANPSRVDFSHQVEDQSVRIAGLRARNAKLSTVAGRLRSELSSIDKGSDALEGAEREYRLAELNYLTYARKNEEARISQVMDSQQVANVVIFSRPSWPYAPIYPRKLFLMQVSIPLFLAFGVLVAALVHTMSDKIRTGRDLSDLQDLSFLGTVSVPRPVISAPATTHL